MKQYNKNIYNFSSPLAAHHAPGSTSCGKKSPGEAMFNSQLGSGNDDKKIWPARLQSADNHTTRVGSDNGKDITSCPAGQYGSGTPIISKWQMGVPLRPQCINDDKKDKDYYDPCWQFGYKVPGIPGNTKNTWGTCGQQPSMEGAPYGCTTSSVDCWYNKNRKWNASATNGTLCIKAPPPFHTDWKPDTDTEKCKTNEKKINGECTDCNFPEDPHSTFKCNDIGWSGCWQKNIGCTGCHRCAQGYYGCNSKNPDSSSCKDQVLLEEKKSGVSYYDTQEDCEKNCSKTKKKVNKPIKSKKPEKVENYKDLTSKPVNKCDEGWKIQEGKCEDCKGTCNPVDSGCYNNGGGCKGCYRCTRPDCSICPAGSYCPKGSPVEIPCPPDTYNKSKGAKSVDECQKCPGAPAGSTSCSLKMYTCDTSNGILCTDPVSPVSGDKLKYFETEKECLDTYPDCECQHGSTPIAIGLRTKTSACKCDSSDPNNAYQRGYLCDLPWKAGRCPVGFGRITGEHIQQNYSFCYQLKKGKRSPQGYVACDYPGKPNNCPTSPRLTMATDYAGNKLPMHDCKFEDKTFGNVCKLSERGGQLVWPDYSIPGIIKKPR
jgi:hypothetical protein